MFFKNFTPFKLRADRPVTVEFLAEHLARRCFVPCSNSQLESSGFVPPLPVFGKAPEPADYVFEVARPDGERFVLVTLRFESRLLPASVIKKAFVERCAELERTTGAPIKGRIKKDLKEEVIRALIPKAFTRQTDVRAVFAMKSGWLFVESSSPTKTDSFMTRLVGALELAPVRKPKPKCPLSSAMQAWLISGEAPAGFTVDRECELKGENAATIRYTHLNLDNDEVRRHVREGKAPAQVALTYDDRLSFVITSKMVFKKIGLSLAGASQEARDNMTPIDAENESQVREELNEDALSLGADVLIAATAFVRGVDALMDSLGGEDPNADEQASAAEADAKAAAEANGNASENLAAAFNGGGSDVDAGPDPLYEQAVALVLEFDRPSISFVQRHFMMGYNRAARLVEQMELNGIVSPANESGVRTVISQ